MSNLKPRDFYLLALSAVLLYLLLTLLAPFATTLLLAVLLVALFQPIHRRLVSVFKRRSIATLFSTLLVVLIVVVPIAILLSVVGGELSTLTPKGTAFINKFLVSESGDVKIITTINDLLKNINPGLSLDTETVKSTVLNVISSAGNILSALLVGVFQNAASIFAQLIVFLFALALIFQDYPKLTGVVRRYSPLGNDLDDLLLHKFISTGKGIIKGLFVVASIHALIITSIFYLFGIEGLGILFVLIFLTSLIPGGSQLIWVPVAIILGLTGGWAVGLALFISCIVAMNLVDSLLRPMLTSGGTAMHPLLSITSVLGGLIVFGLAGLLYGPLIAVMFITIMDAYNVRFK